MLKIEDYFQKLDFIKFDETLVNFKKYNTRVNVNNLGGVFDIDIDSEVERIIKNEISQSIYKNICRELYNIDRITDINNMKFVNHIGGDIDDGKFYKIVVDEIENSNYKNVITNGYVGSVIQDSNKFHITPSVISSGVIIYPIGNIRKTNIFVDPYIKFNETYFCLLNEVSLNIKNLEIVDKIDEHNINTYKYIEYEMCFNPNDSKLVLVVTSKNQDSYTRYKSILRDKRIDILLNDN
jgi:hypothetical protein